jgi:hypothetical protein
MEQNMSYPDVIPPPPAPENIMQTQGQLPAAIALPLNAVKALAKYYKDFSWVIKLTGQKVPRELDTALRALADNDSPEAVQDLQRLAGGGTPDPYNIRPVEIPAPRIGERVLTNDIAQQAWTLHYQHHWTFRQIAEYLTEEGYPVSHTTVSNYISEIDEDIAEEQNSKSAKMKRAFLIGALIIGPSLATFLVVHFLRV